MRSERIKAWLLLGILSVAIGEVSLGSAPWGLLNPGQALFLLPLYGGHLLVLASWIFAKGRQPSLLAIWLAGVIFGLYEFYVTKVLWDQPWDDVVNAGLVEWPSLVVVAGFWHPFMSFALPLVIGEQVLVTEPRLLGRVSPGFRAWWGRWRWPLIVLGMLALAALMPDPVTALVSYAGTMLLVAGAIRWLRPAQPWETFGELLPRRWELLPIVGGIVAVAAVFFTLYNPDVDVTPARHLAAWTCYAAVAGMLAVHLRKRVALPEVVRFDMRRTFTVRRLVVVALLAAAAALIPWMDVWGVAVIWAGGGLLAVVLAVRAVAGLWRTPKISEPAPHSVGSYHPRL